MVAQPMRVGALALAYAVATAALVLVTVLASNLVLSAVAGLGVDAAGSSPPAAEAVLLSAEPNTRSAAEDRCGPRRERAAERSHRADRCSGRRAAGGTPRP